MTWDKLWRIALWGGILLTVRANRRHGRLPTTWVVHLVGNTLLVWLPELYSGVSAVLNLDERFARRRDWPATGHRLARDLIVRNSRYAEYITPVELGVMAAHPRIDIYKSEWANRQLFGLGLDSIPHAATAFALTQMTFDALSNSEVQSRLPESARRAALVSAVVLTIASVVYETGEWAIHTSELRTAKKDPSLVAMEWSLPDTLQDLFANFVGWVLAVWHRTPRSRL